MCSSIELYSHTPVLGTIRSIMPIRITDTAAAIIQGARLLFGGLSQVPDDTWAAILRGRVANAGMEVELAISLGREVAQWLGEYWEEDLWKKGDFWGGRPPTN